MALSLGCASRSTAPFVPRVQHFAERHAMKQPVIPVANAFKARAVLLERLRQKPSIWSSTRLTLGPARPASGSRSRNVCPTAPAQTRSIVAPAVPPVFAGVFQIGPSRGYGSRRGMRPAKRRRQRSSTSSSIERSQAVSAEKRSTFHGTGRSWAGRTKWVRRAHSPAARTWPDRRLPGEPERQHVPRQQFPLGKVRSLIGKPLAASRYRS